MIRREEKEFKKICKVSDLQEGYGKRFMIEDVDAAVFKVNGKIYALSNICPHQKSAVMYNSFIEIDRIVCPNHGWEFYLSDGRQPGGGGGLDSYNVKVEDGFVYVKVFTKELNW